MALADDVQNRVSANLLRELTNQGDTSATTVNTTVLGYAAADAAGEFLVETGLTLDTSKAQHVAAGVIGVLYYLYSYSGIETSTATKQREQWYRWLSKIDSTEGGGRRLLPSTTSKLSPTEEREGARPDFERSRFSEYTLTMPMRDEENDDLGGVMEP